MEYELLRDKLVEIALEWQRKYGVAPSITSTISEYDATKLIGMSDEEYAGQGETRTAVSRGFDFICEGKRYQVKANRPSGKPGSRVTLVGKARNYEWDYLIWILYYKSYEIEEAWLWEVDQYRKKFDLKKRLSPEDMRLGKCLAIDQKPWLEQLLQKRRELNWCVKPGCTTCGCQYFRGHFLELLSRTIGFQLSEQKGLRERLNAISSDDLALCFKEIVKALEELPKSNLDNHDNQALEVILIDLYAMKLAPLISLSQPYGDIIKDTWVEGKFSAIEDVAMRDREIQKERAEYNSPERVKEREEKKEEIRIATQEKVKDRLEKSSQRKSEINDFLDSFSQRDEKSRLSTLASEELNMPLDVIPPDLVPVNPEIVSTLSEEDKDRLVARIDRRRGVWGELKEVLNR
jgi:hypothetical protein